MIAQLSEVADETFDYVVIGGGVSLYHIIGLMCGTYECRPQD